MMTELLQAWPKSHAIERRCRTDTHALFGGRSHHASRIFQDPLFVQMESRIHPGANLAFLVCPLNLPKASRRQADSTRSGRPFRFQQTGPISRSSISAGDRVIRRSVFEIGQFLNSDDARLMAIFHALIGISRCSRPFPAAQRVEARVSLRWGSRNRCLDLVQVDWSGLQTAATVSTPSIWWPREAHWSSAPGRPAIDLRRDQAFSARF